MELSVQIGLLFAVATALTSIVGFLYKYRGAVQAPAVRWRHPISSSIALFSSRWYTLGILVAMGSWALHVSALALAPISLVQATIAGGLVLLTVVADRLFGFDVTRRQWIGVGLTAAGLAFLAATLGSTGDGRHASFDALGLGAYVAAACAVGGLLVLAARGTAREATLLAASAGLIWGASDVCIKALSGRLGELGIGVLGHPLALVILVLSLVGLLVSARSLQLGEAVAVIAVTTTASNVLTIAAGPLVFSEPVPNHPLALAARVLALALVVCAAALTPPPVRAAKTA